MILAMFIAEDYRKKGCYDAAITVNRVVVELAQFVVAPQVEWRAWLTRGECFEASGNDRQAWESYRHAIEVIDRMWFALLEEDMLRGFFGDKAVLYDQMVMCCLRLGYDALSLEYCEKAKTRYLGDLVARRQLPRRKSLERVLQKYWDEIEEARQAAKGAPAASEVENRLEVIGVGWDRPVPGSISAIPICRKALEDAVRDSDRDATVSIVRFLWVLAARLPGQPSEEAIRTDLEGLYGELRRLLEAVDNGQWPLPLAERRAISNRFLDSARDLAGEEAPQDLPVWVFSEYGSRWLEDLFTDLDGNGNLGILRLNAVLEGLNAILRHGQVFAVLSEVGTEEEQPILRLREPASPAATGAEVGHVGSHGSPRLSGTRWEYVERLVRGETIPFQELSSWVVGKPETAIVQFCITRRGSIAYLIRGTELIADAGGPLPVRSGASLEVFVRPEFTLRRIKDLLHGSSAAWFPAQQKWLKSVKKGSENASDWFNAIVAVLEDTHRELFAPIDARLKQLGIKRLFLVPHRGLHVVPLHALLRVDGAGRRRYLLDDYEVSYAPSATLAHISKERHDSRAKGRTLCGVANPGVSDLPNSSYEMESVAQHFPADCRIILDRLGALAEVVKQTHFHYSGHANYDWQNPLDSRLELDDMDRLELGSLFEERVRFPCTDLAALSACETGMTDPVDLADEYIGLAGGFLFGGAASILSTLYPVSDQASALLLDHFYSMLMAGTSPAESLRRAQQWVRDATVAQICTHLNKSSGIPASVRQEFLQRFASDPPDEVPFAHPYYWSAFTLTSFL